MWRIILLKMNWLYWRCNINTTLCNTVLCDFWLMWCVMGFKLVFVCFWFNRLPPFAFKYKQCFLSWQALKYLLFPSYINGKEDNIGGSGGTAVGSCRHFCGRLLRCGEKDGAKSACEPEGSCGSRCWAVFRGRQVRASITDCKRTCTRLTLSHIKIPVNLHCLIYLSLPVQGLKIFSVKTNPPPLPALGVL